MNEVRRGDIYYAELNPVVGSEQGGTRPVLVVQNNIGNKFSPTTIIAAITSQLTKAKLPTHVQMPADQSGLARDSVILLEQIRTIDKNRLRERIGSVSEEIMSRVTNAWMISGGVVDFQERKEAYSKYFRFIIDEKVEMIEDYDYEFKEIKGGNPVNAINNTIAEYSTSFLNGKGGRIFYGITNERVVKGVQVSPEKQDEINQTIYNNLANIQPAISPDYYEIIYHPVGTTDGGEINQLYVIEVSVPINKDKSTIYYAKGTELHVRVKGVKKRLLGTEITSYIRKKVLEENI